MPRSVLTTSRLPVRDDVTLKPGAKPLSEVKLLRQTTEEIAKGVPEVIEQWRDTFSYERLAHP